MKNKIISLCLLLICSIRVFSGQEFLDNFEYYRAYTNYNGTAYNGSSIIVYGDAGVITRSIDGGIHWMRVSLPDSFNIMSITNVGYDYFGVLNKKFIIKSSDNGLNWQMFDLGDIEFYKINQKNNFLYCMSSKKIFVIDQNLAVKKEYNIVVDSNYYDFVVTGDNLIYSSGKGKLTQINLLNDKTKIINMSDYGICSDCPVPTKLFNKGNKTYFKLGFNLFSFDGSKAVSVFNTGRVSTFNSNGSDIFAIYTYTIGKYSLRDSLLFVKINEGTQNSSRINNTENDRYASKLQFAELKYLSVDTVIAVGKNMLIYMSYDAGRTWQLKSHYWIENDYGEKFIIDKNHITFVAPYVKFIKTTDAGVTWLPQKNYDKRYEDERFGDINNSFKPYFVNSNFGFAHYHTMISNFINFAYSNDFLDTVKLMISNEIKGYPLDKPIKVCINNDQTLFAKPSHWLQNKFTVIYSIDDEINAKRVALFDSAHVVFMDSFDNQELLTLVINYKGCYYIDSTAYYDSVYVSLLSSTDTASTWNKLIDFHILDSNEVINNVSRIDDYIFISVIGQGPTTQVYRLNTKTLEIDVILTKNEWQTDVNGLVKAGSKTFINSVYFRQNGIEFEVLQNDDIANQPNVWRNITPKERYNSFSIISKYDSLIFISAYDSLMKTPTCWVAKPKTTTPVEEQTESKNYLYCFPPYPVPATNTVRSLIYWDTSLDIENDDIAVYDIFGNKVAGKDKITIDKQNSYSGILSWNCTNVPDGIYLIRLIHGTETRTMKVIVSK
jgi:hypothetical protein